MSAAGKILNLWTNAFLAFFYPEVCQLCRNQRASPAQGYVCTECRSRVQFIRPPFCGRCGLPFEGDISTPFECANCRGLDLAFTSARSAAVARGPVLEAIHRYKYHRALWFETFLAGLLIQEAGPELRAGSWDGIVPVPLHPGREREREFNQAARLAGRLAAATGLPVRNRLLKRRRPTRTQTLLTREPRAANVDDAFALRNGPLVEGQRLVLVDDVFTTGATTNACARVLQVGGAGAVCVWTVARGV